MKYFSMFSGVGGFELGIKQAYESLYEKTDSKSSLTKSDLQNTIDKNERRKQATCIGYSEVDKYAIQIYEKHFKHKNYGNCTKINARELPDFDLLVGGFPCQAFSIAGKRKGFNDTRGTLFFDIARILAEKRPRLVVLENVKGLLSHNKGKTFQTILGVLSDLGYGVEWQVLNSKNFGVPQNRERVFIVGHSRGGSGRKVFPIEGSGKETKNLVYAQKADREIARIYDPKGLAPTLHLKTGGWQEPKIVASRGRNPANPSDRKTGSPTEQRLEVNKQGTTNTLTNVQKDNWLLKENRVRRLTPTECERLQGFPDGFSKFGINEKAEKVLISDTQRYKCLGNAVSCPVITAIVKRLSKCNRSSI